MTFNAFFPAARHRTLTRRHHCCSGDRVGRIGRRTMMYRRILLADDGVYAAVVVGPAIVRTTFWVYSIAATAVHATILLRSWPASVQRTEAVSRAVATAAVGAGGGQQHQQ